MSVSSSIVAVHLDLKGMPPTKERLLELPRVFRLGGFNAVVVEWEDMLPWSVDRRFRSEAAYSEQTVKDFHAESCRQNLEVIPLTQCLGHMETFLRYGDYAPLREVPHRSDVINPLAEGASEFVGKLIDDVLRLSSGLKYFHLGGDEAWSFGSHPATKSYVDKHGKASLYLHHVEPLLDKLLSKNIRPILWHDMMIEWEQESLNRISAKADVCVWGYDGDPETVPDHWNAKYIRRFKENGVRMWSGTAFKGAESFSADLPDAVARPYNCQAWFETSRRYGISNIIATGWSRYSTDRCQTVPLEGALDVMILCGHILRDGNPPGDGIANSLRLLATIDEQRGFEECFASLKKISVARKNYWTLIQYFREEIIIPYLDFQRSGSGILIRRLTELRQQLNDAEEAAGLIFNSFKGKVSDHWITRYCDERIIPMRREMKYAEEAAQKFDPAGYQALRTTWKEDQRGIHR